jgi:AhpD family alkylhydroperoxidase
MCVIPGSLRVVIMSFENELAAISVKGKEKAAEDKDGPEILITDVLYDNAIQKSSTLDAKTIELISLAVSAATRCSHCLKLHIKLASNLGVPDDQIAAAIFLAGNLTTASVLATATRHLDEEHEICRICEISNKACEIHGAIKT